MRALGPLVRPAAPAIWLLATLPPLFWAGNFVVGRVMRDTAPPVQLSLWRWVVAALVLLPFALPDLRHDRARIGRNLPFLALLALVGVTAFNCFVYAALHHTTVVNGALINALLPVATFLLAYLVLGDRLSPRQLVGIAVSLAGAVVVVTRGRPGDLLGFVPNRGDVLVFAGMSCWALYTTLVKWRPLALRPLSLLAATFALGALFHLPAAIVEFAMQGGVPVTGGTLAAILYLALFPSIAAYIIWNRAIAALGPGRLGMFMHLMPIYGAVLAFVFLGEELGPYHAVAFVLVVAGIGLVTAPPGGLRRAGAP